jgi:NAD(P)-dependent dehydrogenase (short-subunit alcohol dehydrogenase family)
VYSFANKTMTKHTSGQHQVPPKWDASQVPSLQGKVAIVTGANSGIGFATAKALVAEGANVVLACRNEARGVAAAKRIHDELALDSRSDGATLGRAEFMQLDVSSLASVVQFVEAFKARYKRLDILINNAGIMAVEYVESVDGFESQFATNHLGHFVLTAQLLDMVKQSEDARVVCITSLSQRNAKFKAEELVWPRERKYNQQLVYANTKLYNLLFAQELHRRLNARGIQNVKVSASHPGFTSTNLMSPTMQVHGHFVHFLFHTVSTISQTPEMGILPTLYAATAPNVPGGLMYGPEGFHNMWGYPTVERPQNAGVTEEAARAVWEQSEQFAKISFAV